MSDETKNTNNAGTQEQKTPKAGAKEQKTPKDDATAELQAKLAAAEAELAALKAAQTPKQTGDDTAATGEAPERKVTVFIPRGASNDEPNLFVSVNGVNYLLPKGQESEVPEHIAGEIMRSNKAAQVRDMNKDKLLGAGQQGQ